MSDTPRVYQSTDAGAPQLAGQPGSFASLMDAVLVDGYGAGPNARPGLGWMRAFTSLNKRVFRNDPASYSGCYIRFDDANAQYVLVDAYEAMSSTDTGSGRFSSTSNAWAKSNAASAATRSWICVGTARCVYVAIQMAGTGNWVGQFFGDTFPVVSTDHWNFMYTRSQSSAAYNPTTSLGMNITGYSSSIQRSTDGVSGSAVCRAVSALFSNVNNWGSQGFPYPLHGLFGALVSRGFFREGDVASGGPPRGYFPGLWLPEHNMSSIHAVGEVVSDLVPGAEVVAIATSGSNAANRIYLDISNPWTSP